MFNVNLSVLCDAALVALAKSWTQAAKASGLIAVNPYYLELARRGVVRFRAAVLAARVNPWA